MKILKEYTAGEFMAGVVIANGVTVGPSEQELTDKLTRLVEERSDREFPEDRRICIRSMLKAGGFKPSGRNKPASEYLAQAAREDRFPYINNLVDINNYISLLSHLPVSLLNLDLFGDEIVLRCALEGESYVFNESGQTIELEGLVCAYNGKNKPLGNPVKDSMEAKLKDDTTGVLGIIYSSMGCTSREQLEYFTEQFEKMIVTFGGASESERHIL